MKFLLLTSCLLLATSSLVAGENDPPILIIPQGMFRTLNEFQFQGKNGYVIQCVGEENINAWNKDHPYVTIYKLEVIPTTLHPHRTFFCIMYKNKELKAEVEKPNKE